VNWATIKALLEAAGVNGVPLTGGSAANPFDGEEFAEAKGDMLALARLVRGALEKKYEAEGRRDTWADLEALFADRVVAREDGKLVAYPFTVGDDDKVTLGAAQPVEQTFAIAAPATPANPPAPLPTGAIIEAVAAKDGEAGTRFKVRIVQAGLSGNANFYSDIVLREAAPLFEGVRVFVKADQEHLARAATGKDVRNLVGKITDVTFVEGSAPDTGELQGVLHVLDAAGDIAARMTEAVSRNMADVFGLSMDADGTARMGKVGAKPARIATKILKVRSVDIIVEPGAGGGIINLIEAQEDQLLNREQIIALLEAKGLLAGKNPAQMSEADLTAILTEAVGTNPNGGEGTRALQIPDAAAIARQVDALVDARVYLREAVGTSRLPKAAQDRVIALVEAKGSFTRADVDAAIKAEREYVAAFTESGRVTGLGGTARIEAGETRAEKISAMFDAFFDTSHTDHRHARSFRACYVEATGDVNVTGQLQDCDPVRLSEALNSASFAEVLGNAMTRRMIADYRAKSNYDVWRLLTGDPVPISDFRTQERTRFGGYGDLPAVGESDPYMPLTSPSDEKAEYAVSKRGGTEELTLEMITNDDVGAVRRIPTKMSRAAKRTLAKFVLDFLRTNPTIYDGKALFHADHGNLGAAVLASAPLAAGRLAMLKQAEMDSNDPLGIGPKYLWVSPDNEETAVDLFRRTTENDKNFQQSLALEVVPVWYWSDVNDWCLSADVMDIPVVELGFLNGSEEPQLFIQDNPSVGSMFTHDKVTYKIRHIYGGNVLDYRGLYKGVVA